MTQNLANQVLMALEMRDALSFEDIASAVFGIRNADASMARKLVVAVIGDDDRFMIEAERVRLAPAGAAAEEADAVMTAASVTQVPNTRGGKAVGEVALVTFDRTGVLETHAFVIQPADSLARRCLIGIGVDPEEIRRAADARSVRERVVELLHPPLVTVHAGPLRRLMDSLPEPLLPLSRLAAAALGRQQWGLESVCRALGVHLPEVRRAAAEATIIAACARDLIERIRLEHGVSGPLPEALSEIIAADAPAPPPNALLDKGVVSRIPRASGVYIMKDAMGFPVYVGKSKNLRGRVAGYFTRTGGEEEKKRWIQKQVRTIDWEVTGSELIALIREAELIERHHPTVNRQFDVHEREHPFVGPRSVAVVLPSARKGFLDIVTVQRGRQVEICRIGRRGGLSRKLEQAVERCFDEGVAARPSDERVARIAASWLERHRGKVDYVVIDEQQDAVHAIEAVRKLIGETLGA